MKFDNRFRSTNEVVIECQKCIDDLKRVMRNSKKRGDNDYGLERSRLGEIAGYEWIIYRITGESSQSEQQGALAGKMQKANLLN